MPIRPYGSGKYNTILDSFIHVASRTIDGADDELGDTETFDYYSKVKNDADFIKLVKEAAKDAGEKLNVDEMLALKECRGGFIIHEDGQGFVNVEFYPTPALLENYWVKTTEDYEDFQDSNEDEEDEEDEENL